MSTKKEKLLAVADPCADLKWNFNDPDGLKFPDAAKRHNAAVDEAVRRTRAERQDFTNRVENAIHEAAKFDADLRKFEDWFKEVGRVAVLNGWAKDVVADFDADSWKDYFDDGLTPAQAMAEELQEAMR